MKFTDETMTKKINKLRVEAAAVGDIAQVALCDRALAGELAALDACADAILDAIDAADGGAA